MKPIDPGYETWRGGNSWKERPGRLDFLSDSRFFFLVVVPGAFLLALVVGVTSWLLP